MSIEEMIKKFKARRSYLTNGAGLLAKNWGVDINDVKEAKKRARLSLLEEDFEMDEAVDRPFKRMFFDIETSYNKIADFACGYGKTVGPHQILKERAIICICWKWQGEDKVHHLQWDKDQCDKRMLQDFTDVLAEADEVIGHNGDRFDIKWVRTRCLFHDIPFNANIKSLDTLKKAKNAFYFNSNKLDYIAKFLGVGSKTDTGGFQLWLDVCEKNDKEAMHKMITYCKNDVVILEKVFDKMQSYIHQNSHTGVARGGDKYCCPACGSDNIRLLSMPVTRAGTQQYHVECNSCSTDYKLSKTVWDKYLKGE